MRQQPSLINNSRPRVWNARTRCKKKATCEFGRHNGMPLCEPVWHYFWRDSTLKGPVKEWQRPRADVIRLETVTRAVMRPKYANCPGQIINTIATDVCARSARTGGRKKKHHNNGHRHKANCRHECIQSRRIRAVTSTLERRCLLCLFTPTVSALDRRRLMVDSSVGQHSQ